MWQQATHQIFQPVVVVVIPIYHITGIYFCIIYKSATERKSTCTHTWSPAVEFVKKSDSYLGAHTIQEQHVECHGEVISDIQECIYKQLPQKNKLSTVKPRGVLVCVAVNAQL